MKWTPLEISLDGVTHRARYRVMTDMIEVETSRAQRRLPRGPLRPEVTAANVLRQMVRQALNAA